MAPHSNSLSICTFNCRSIKSSVTEVVDLCNKFDIICLQEHWLLPNEISYLSNIHPDFLAVGHSAVNLSQEILIGRPYGGTGILYKRSLGQLVTAVDLNNARITAVVMSLTCGPTLLVSVYLPTDYGDNDSLDSFIETCAAITAIYQESEAVHIIIAGDFNCQLGNRYYKYLIDFVTENRLQLTDINRLDNVFTFCSDATNNVSWIDHIFCSVDLDRKISSCNILQEYVSSDHKPLCVTLDNIVSVTNGTLLHNNSDQLNNYIFDWSNCNNDNIDAYRNKLDSLLCQVNIPNVLFDNNTDYSTANTNLLDNYYNAVMDCVTVASRVCIPSRMCNYNSPSYAIPGWNDYVKDKHEAARDAFLEWSYLGRPRSGPVYILMQRTRAQFKLSLRYCKQHEDLLRADALASSVSNKDYRKFWDNVHKANNDRATKYSDIIDGCVGDTAIADRWREHFEKLYNSVDDSNLRAQFHQRLIAAVSDNYIAVNITVQDIIDACCKQKLGKACGPDNISMEGIIYGTHRLYIHLCLLFNLFLKHCYLPTSFMQSTIVPLVKNKNGDLTSLDNYRAIAISNALSKLFEAVIAQYLQSDSDFDKFQFGFKRGLSTSLCTNILKQTVDYYTTRGSHVFVCFVDFNKAFDNVSHCKLFSKLLDDNVNCVIVRLLDFWYSNQECRVRWHNVVSVSFMIRNGTRQGSVLSPYLFSRYIRDMLGAVANSQIGCKIANQFINILAYADDLVLIAPSWRALQDLLSVLYSNANEINLSCNLNKTVCMMFKPKNRNRIIADVFPTLSVGDCCINFVTTFKYLGHILNDNLRDDDDIQREVKNMYVRTNILLRKFGKCSFNVKLKLFRTYCLCFYDIALWHSYRISSLNKFRSCYNRCIKIFLGYKRRDSLTSVLLDSGLPSFNTVLHNSSASFVNCVSSCSNQIVSLLNAVLVR